MELIKYFDSFKFKYDCSKIKTFLADLELVP